MDTYLLAKFFHLLALLVAAGVTAVTKLAAGRRDRARTVGEVLEWHGVLLSAARLFPLCLVVFAVTGGYMLSVAHVKPSAGFIVAGMLGVVLLFASGTYLGIKGAGLKTMLEQLAAKGADQPAPKLVPPTMIVLLPTINTGIALAVAYVMVTKPTSIPIALGIVALGIVLGFFAAPKRAASVAAQPMSVQQS